MTFSREVRARVMVAVIAAALSGLITHSVGVVTVGGDLRELRSGQVRLERQVAEVRRLLFDHINAR